MNYTTAQFYKEFHCIGGICEDSCCENWEIDLDDYSLKQYMKQNGDFGKRLKDCTKVKEKQFILNGTRCPFLNDENLCDIFIEMGEECLCQTCTNFPRHIEEFDHLKEVSLTMSCPEASRIMLAKTEKMTFITKEGTDEEFGLKHLPEKKSFAFWKKDKPNKLNKILFEQLELVRDCLFEILQNRCVPIRERAATVLLFADEVQKCIDKGEYLDIAELVTKYHKPEQTEQLQAYLHQYESDVNKKQQWMKQVLNMYEGLETIKPEWTILLKESITAMHNQVDYASAYKEFNAYYKEKEYEFEHILVYYIFNYFLGASYDEDAFTKVKFAIVSYLVILELDIATWIKNQKSFGYEDQVFVAHAYSKEVEHSYNNFESLMLVMSAHPILEKTNILNALL